MYTNEEMLLDCLEDLAACEALQEKRWLIGIPGELHTFTESVCGVFDDSRFGDELDKGRVEERYGEYFAKKANQLSQLIGKLPHDISPKEELHHPIMGEIRLLSKFLLDELRRDENYFSDQWLSRPAYLRDIPLQ